MILNNFAKMLWSGISNSAASNAGLIAINGTAVTGGVYAIAATSISNYAGGNTSTSNTSYTSLGCISLTFGSGTTEVTADDYQMESPYDTTNHFSWQNQAQSSVGDNLTKVITASICNISEEDLTVSEIGAVMFHTNKINYILIARSLITPVTIEPNETKTFQYTLDLSGIAG